MEYQETRPMTILLARSREQDNPTLEVGSFFIEYALLLPDQARIDEWYNTYPPLAWQDLGGPESCAIMERRVDQSPGLTLTGDWRIVQHAYTVWKALWASGPLYNWETESLHPLHAFASASRCRVREIEEELQSLTDQRLKMAFNTRFRAETYHLRSQERIDAMRKTFLQEFEQANQERLAQVKMLEAERERLESGAGAPALESSEDVPSVCGQEPSDD